MTTHAAPHAHAHSHAPQSFGRAFAIAITLNFGFVLIEFGYGFLAHSTALMADAGHNLSDVLGLAIAWLAVILARRQATANYSYGLRSASILAALINALLLLIACAAIGWEAIQRLQHPAPVQGMTVAVVAGIGVLINGFSAWLFMRGSANDLNIRGAYLHMAADAAISVGVALAGLGMLWTGWLWLDPVMSLLIVAVILIGTWGLLRDSVRLSLQAVPRQIDYQAVQHYLATQQGVTAVNDLHIWSLSTTEVALTAHLTAPLGLSDGEQDAIAEQLRHQFSIQHSTLQVHQAAQNQCSLNQAHSH